MGELFSIPTLDLEADLASAEARREEIRAMAGHDHPERFCPISLGDWLDLCRKAGVPFVPAERVAAPLLEDCLAFESLGEPRERLSAAWKEMDAAQLDRHMLRMDCASSLEIKISLSNGNTEFRPEFGKIILDDPRLFGILFEYPREEVPVWRRPWIETLVYERYPVEYRAFVRDGELRGISSYYPQRPLPEFPRHLDAVREMTEALIAHVQPPFLWHTTGMLDGTPLDLARVHFTADFLVSRDGQILLLEGGPPHELGAHMCCFRPGEIEGIALVDRNHEEEETS